MVKRPLSSIFAEKFLKSTGPFIRFLHLRIPIEVRYKRAYFDNNGAQLAYILLPNQNPFTAGHSYSKIAFQAADFRVITFILPLLLC